MRFPNAQAIQKWSDLEKLDLEMREWTDIFTDKIFIPSRHEKRRIATVVFPYSRYYCDVERLKDDPLEEIGQGIIYEKLRDSNTTRTLSDAEKTEISKEWQFYQNFLRNELVPNALLLDCHSFPKFLAPEIDICLGFNADATRPNDETLEVVREHFEKFGYRVALNKPFSDAIAPKSNVKYTSLMIEINKDIYLLDDLSLKADAYKIHDILDVLYHKLLGD
jgi:N-formylglutamate amidohydrolase